MYEYRATITRVVDGDTYDARVDLGFNISFDIRIRLNTYDTPETWRPVNEAERTHGEEATAFVEKALSHNPNVRIVTYKEGASIYGRFSADVYYMDEQGIERNLGSMLDQHKLLKRESYDGEES